MRLARWVGVVLVALVVWAGGVQMTKAQAGPPSEQPVQAQTAQQQPQQAYTLPPEKLAKAIALNRIRMVLEIAGSVWGLVVLWLLLRLRAAAGLERWAERVAQRRWLQGLVFFAALAAILTTAGLPLDLIGETASRHYGISVQSWAGWFGDWGKALGLAVVVGSLLLLLFNWIVKVSPRRYWLWCWAIAVPMAVLVTFVAPVLIEPMFDKFEPLEKTNPKLVAELEQVVARTGTNIPPDRMYLMKASVKTNGLNAYVSGLGATKRVVVWDTTAGRIPDDEVMFIFGHESGHYVLHHIVKGLVVTAVALFFVFWACARFAEWMARRFGGWWGLTVHEGVVPLATRTGFVVLIFALSIAGFLLEPASNTVSRYFEHQADVYGQEAIHGLVPDPQKTAVAAFDALGEAWLEDPNPNRFIEIWLYDHPSVKNRAEFAAHYDPWKNGGHGEFFQQ
ncbi:MAG TPA: M48 family metallopeptidase [Terracidiphilus sp.]|nr:M48 family metallopeptidase [Terracidiphilus sp.]